jgi:hypothetical protein
MGAPDPASWQKPGRPSGARTAASTGPFLPIKRAAIPAVKDTNWIANPIDAFILAKLQENGMKPNPPADKRALIRRATYDLTGLPPTPGKSRLCR